MHQLHRFHYISMEMDETEWYHKNLNLGRDWKVDSVRYLTSPLKVKVYVSFIGKYRCPICGDPCLGFDTVHVDGGTWITAGPSAMSSPTSLG